MSSTTQSRHLKSTELDHVGIRVLAVLKRAAVPTDADPSQLRGRQRRQSGRKLFGPYVDHLVFTGETRFASHLELTLGQTEAPLLEQHAHDLRIDAHADNDLGRRLALFQAFEHESGKLVPRTLGRGRNRRVRVSTALRTRFVRQLDRERRNFRRIKPMDLVIIHVRVQPRSLI